MVFQPFQADSKVQAAAKIRANEILKSFSHTRPDGRAFSTALNEAGATYSGAGENIAKGQRTPEEVVNAWMNSAGHRANILNSKYKYLGVGCVKAAVLHTLGLRYLHINFKFYISLVCSIINAGALNASAFFNWR